MLKKLMKISAMLMVILFAFSVSLLADEQRLTYEQRMFEEQLKEINQRILDFVMENNTNHVIYSEIEGFKEFIERMSARTMCVNLISGVATRDVVLYEIYESVMIDGFLSYILVYSDRSFDIVTITTYTIENGIETLIESIESEVEILSNGEVIFNQFFAGTGPRNTRIIHNMRSIPGLPLPHITRTLGLRTYYTVPTSEFYISITNSNTWDSTFFAPINSINHFCRVVTRTGQPAIIEGQYNFTTAGNIAGWTDALRKQLLLGILNNNRGTSVRVTLFAR